MEAGRIMNMQPVQMTVCAIGILVMLQQHRICSRMFVQRDQRVSSIDIIASVDRGIMRQIR